MPYPHVTQFETLDLRRDRARDTVDVPTRATVRPASPRRLPRLWRLRRTDPCAPGTA